MTVFLGPFALKTREMTLYLLHNLMQRYIGSLLIMGLSMLGDNLEVIRLMCEP